MDDTYAGVGRALTQWEEIELALSFLYGTFVGKPNDAEAFREYGKGPIFDSRMTGLKEAAAKFFIAHHHQELEGVFDKLAEDIRNFSHRRNEIAHGTVRPMLWLRPSKTDPFTYCLIPSHYTKKKFDAAGLPVYVYTFWELAYYATWFSRMMIFVTRLRLDIEQRFSLFPKVDEP